MSSTSKIAVITAASIGVVVTQSSSLRAEIEGSSPAEKVTKIAAPIAVDEEVLYSALPDDVLEKAAGFGRLYLAYSVPTECLKKPASSSSKKPSRVKK
jgi:hypothetical protein